ncbi:hypothetical protein TSUD_128020 [Trifolium subterraneum]|nr:hypothetical protein TSUD_128020 [Trifolium subterraneum]
MMATGAVASLPKLPPVRRDGHCIEENVVPTSKFTRVRVAAPTSKFPRLVLTPRFPRGITPVDGSRPFSCRRTRSQPATILCAEALMQNARCRAAQTQTTTREAPKITHLPGKENSPQLEENSPQLDVGGSGFPPRDDGGRGGGGGGGNWSGGFFFFGFLAFLGFLKDKESEDDDDDYAYTGNRRRRR